MTDEYLSREELEALIKAHRKDRVFVRNEQKQTVLAPWLLELRSRQAHHVAEQILDKPISIKRWQNLWVRSTSPDSDPTRPQQPNTATFGGYRLKPARFAGIAKPKKKQKDGR
ncbi:MAG: hypothetical protein GXY36_10115 [Chloroflexi bacterium]|nr:hypothetical protein [Chloroflexota bacterium]